MVDNARIYYIENCYALRGCLHCPDCLAFALKYHRLAELLEEKDQKAADRSRTLATKFILSTITSENLPCEHALSSADLKNYINSLMEGESQLPHCHYEFHR